jgi:hypothetical protein
MAPASRIVGNDPHDSEIDQRVLGLSYYLRTPTLPRTKPNRVRRVDFVAWLVTCRCVVKLLRSVLKGKPAPPGFQSPHALRFTACVHIAGNGKTHHSLNSDSRSSLELDCRWQLSARGAFCVLIQTSGCELRLRQNRQISNHSINLEQFEHGPLGAFDITLTANTRRRRDAVFKRSKYIRCGAQHSIDRIGKFSQWANGEQTPSEPAASKYRECAVYGESLTRDLNNRSSWTGRAFSGWPTPLPYPKTLIGHCENTFAIHVNFKEVIRITCPESLEVCIAHPTKQSVISPITRQANMKYRSNLKQSVAKETPRVIAGAVVSDFCDRRQRLPTSCRWIGFGELRFHRTNFLSLASLSESRSIV